MLVWRTLVSAVMNLRVPWNTGNFLTSCKQVSFSRRTLHHGVSKYRISPLVLHCCPRHEVWWNKRRTWTSQLTAGHAFGQPRTAFYVLRATWVKFGLHAGNMEFSTQGEEGIGMRIFIRIILNVFMYTSCATEYADNNRRHLFKKNAFHDLGYSWRIKDQLDVTCYFISLLMCSTCFGH